MLGKVKHCIGTLGLSLGCFLSFQKYFSQGQLPKRAIFQAATYQVCPSRSARSHPVLAAALGPLSHPSCSARPPIAACGTSESLTQPWGSCRLEKCTYGMLPLGKLSLGKSPLGKCLWESTLIKLFCDDCLTYIFS